MAEYEINLESLVKMKRVFEEADEDGSGELDPDEFYEQLGQYLGQGLSPAAVSQLFMRIDADCGGTIDWQEFINYFFLQRAASSAADVGDDWRLHAEDHWRKEWRGAGHKEAVERVHCCGAVGQYVTGGRGGVLKVWSAESLAPVQTVTNGSAWITDCAFLECPSHKRLVVAAQDRTITFYEPVRSAFEFSSRLSCPGTMGPPLCLAELRQGGGGGGAPRLVWGDTEGAVMLLKGDPPPHHSERQLAPRRDYDVLHSGHSDWVTCLQHIPEVGLVSASLDSTLRVLDLERRVLAATVGVHKKGVRAFAHSPAFSLVASGGVERSVLLWQPKGNVNKPVGELPGHSGGVAQLLVADEQSQVITLSGDHVVRVWDLRTHKCVQALAHADWLRPEDSKPTAMTYDTPRRRLVCVSHKPVAWAHRRVEGERQHDSRLVGALYNQTFSVVVSGDEGGTICMWNVCTGQREGGFSIHSKPAGLTPRATPGGSAAALAAPAAQPKLTAMAFDSNQRRLLTALDRGVVQVYNFNSGAVLREFVSRGERQELTAVAFVPRAEEDREGEAPAGESSQQDADVDVREDSRAAEAAEQGGAGAVASRYSDLSEHALLARQQEDARWRQQQEPLTPRGAQSATTSRGASSQASPTSSAAAPGTTNLVLAAGWGRALCVWEEGEDARGAPCRRFPGHGADVLCMAPLGRDIAATGDFDGAVRVWHLPTGACLATCAYEGPEYERAVCCLSWMNVDSSASGLAGSDTSNGCAPASALLLVAGDSGVLQFWQVPLEGQQTPADTSFPTPRPAGLGTDASVSQAEREPGQPAACGLVARFTATHRRQDCITALCMDGGEGGQSGQLWTGDSSGHVALWDVSGVLASANAQAGSTEAAAGGSPSPAGHGDGHSSSGSFRLAVPLLPADHARLPQRLAHWRAAGASVVSMDLLRGGGQGLVLVGGQDAGISVWTRQGGLVGIFGRHSWELDDPASWQDPHAAAAPPPLSPDSGCTGLKPREVIACTPHRTNWVGTTSQTARQAGNGPGSSGAQTARQSARSPTVCSRGASRPHTAPQRGAARAAGSTPATPCSPVEDTEERQAQLLAQLAKLHLPTDGERRGFPSPPSPALLPAAALPAMSPPADALAAGTAQAGSKGHEVNTGNASSGGASPSIAAVRQFLSPQSAGAQLSALAAECAASKAERWGLPVHVQAHSALALQRVEDVPLDTAGMWAQVRAHEGGGGRGRGRGQRSGLPGMSVLPARRPVTPQVSIATIVGRSAGANGARATPPASQKLATLLPHQKA